MPALFVTKSGLPQRVEDARALGRFAPRNDGLGWLLAPILLALLALAPNIASAAAADPTRQVKMMVPYGPGGATDIVARVLAEQLKNKFAQTFIVENKPGAYGILALQEMVRSGADGYTLMIGNVSTNAITPILYASKMPLNYEKDVVPIIRLVDVPEFLIATAKD